MEKKDDLGTNKDGSKNREYCRYCYRNGKFTEPDMTEEQMIEKCIIMMKQMHIPEAQIEHTRSLIPMLDRWKK